MNRSPPRRPRPQIAHQSYYSRLLVDLVPPPHEREWRHPAEISAEHRIVFAAEPPSRRFRVVALVAGFTAVGTAVAAAIAINAMR
jgi:hypothetical protein